MRFGFGPRIKHPFFPGLSSTPAREATAISSALHGSFEELMRAADVGVQVTRAVLVTISEGEAPLSEEERDILWDRFQVPSFVLLLDRKGRVAAYECEARSGLHVSTKYRSASALEGLCACGRPGPRIRLTAGRTARVA